MTTPRLDPQVFDFLFRLTCLEVPIVTVPRGRDQEFIRPIGWQRAPSGDNLSRVESFRPGQALFGVMGGRVAVIDIDTKNGADVERTRQALNAVGVPIYADVRSPSDGRHFYVPGHPELPTVHATAGRDGLKGHPGVEVLSFGANAFLPGTTRPKYNGAGYTILNDNLAALIDGGDPDAGEALAAFVAEHHMSSPVDLEPSPPWDGVPPDSRQAAYLEAALRNTCDELAAMGRDTGRNQALFTAALKLGSLVAGAGLDEGTVITRLTEAADRCGLLEEDGVSSVNATIRSGLRNGRRNPRAVPVAVPAAAMLPVQVKSPTADAKATQVHSGQVRMAYRLAEKYADKLLHVHGIGWHHWDGKRWAKDESGHADRAVLQVLKAALAESVGDKQLRADVARCESGSGLNGVLDIASVLVEFAATVSDLDADPWLFNCANGTLDLHTRALRSHNPKDRLTKVTRGAYDPNADPSLWDAFLARVLPDEAERDYLRRVIGLSVYGRVREHLFTVLIGTGANGKTTAYGAVTNAMGDYARIIDPELLMARERGGPGGPEMLTLIGARLVIGSETQDGRKLDEAIMKRLTGGDELTARGLYKDPVTWRPSHQLLYVTNALPKVKGNDPAVWARVRVVPFDVVVPTQERDPELGERLALHADAILSWVIGGYFDYQDNGGMREPLTVLRATGAYQADSDAVARFVKEMCTTGPALTVFARELYGAWQRWANSEAADPMSERAFGKELDRLGYPVRRTRAGNKRQGLELLLETDSEGQS